MHRMCITWVLPLFSLGGMFAKLCHLWLTATFYHFVDSILLLLLLLYLLCVIADFVIVFASFFPFLFTSVLSLIIHNDLSLFWCWQTQRKKEKNSKKISKKMHKLLLNQFICDRFYIYGLAVAEGCSIFSVWNTNCWTRVEPCAFFTN